MTKTLIKPRIFPNKQKQKVKQEFNFTKSNLPPKLQSIKHKLLSKIGLLEYL